MLFHKNIYQFMVLSPALLLLATTCVTKNGAAADTLGIRGSSGGGGGSGGTASFHNLGPCRNSDELLETHPVLCHMLGRLEADSAGLAFEMTDLARQQGLLVGHGKFPPGAPSSGSHAALQAATSAGQLPVVFAHGMGDSCFNSGMVDIGKHTSSLLGGTYVTCIPTGNSQSEDTTNGYFLNMDASVDIFAEKVAQDPELTNGFHAIGFSQGNNVIRGYIARYNTPTVHTFLAINGVNAGEGTVPGCFPDNVMHKEEEQDEGVDGVHVGGLCDLLLEQASRRAYTEFSQQHSFQANYWRDPREKEQEAYHTYSQLARWNNEGSNHNQTLNDNYAKTSRFVWIMASQDGMVWPKEGEQWGAPDPKDPFNHILPMNETEWYQKDLFGLKTAQEGGKNYFESFEGDHLQFSMDEFDGWVKTYLTASDVQQRID